MPFCNLQLFLILVFMCLGFATPAAAQSTRTEDPHPKRILMHYMPWYTTPEIRGEWGGHWTGWGKHDPDHLDAEGLPDIWSKYHPLIGTYDSADPAVLECQLLQMKLAGVDGVIVDWYGISDLHDYDENHVASQALFTVAARLDMEFSVCFEDRTVQELINNDRLKQNQIAEHLSKTLQWLQLHWFRHPHYSHFNGRPLFLLFGPIYISDNAPWESALGSIEPRPAFFPLHHLWKNLSAADGGFTWVHADAWADDATPDAVRRNLHALFRHVGPEPDQVIVSATPGFDDVYDRPMIHLDHREGETLRESFDACMDGPWPLIQLITWNDYGEGTVIEPTHEHGYRLLEVIHEARRSQLGASDFPYTPQDLRLPARLLELRKAGEVDPEILDSIANMLKDGRVENARQALNRLSK